MNPCQHYIMVHVTGEELAMRAALDLARTGRGAVEPNPMVGAVLLREGQVVAGGFHQRFGGPHAEIEALADAERQGIDPAGLVMAVTLEPCRHHGKTPPCTDALIAAKLSRVLVAMLDPDPRMAGQGVAQLSQAGIPVDVGICEAEARELNSPYLKRTTTGLPWVIVKWAQTLDGRIATHSGDSKWISNDQSRKRVHEVRARVDAIMIGVNTAIRDDPALTARDVEVKRRALRVVIDPNGRMSENARMRHDRGPRVITAGRSGDVPFSAPIGGGDLRPVLHYLVEHYHATNVLVEGGATLIGSLFVHGHVDQVLAFIAPKLLGDERAIAAAHGLRIERIAEAHPLQLRTVERFGDDVLLDYRVAGR
ncbi:MAG: bifunctional diaminohydroxyphosphoribosylaminopyrimidine deaminase/5-amino-6-(5-phosphoribosylamino)uracil reductase RibD [Phycisphaeraceae bacterium]|nr:bifunctional diaminohydroxyphosphoribosylaminopyrimidine deaminase/5-amino-6-(5-phosphoribosylamino)uracil reductase RibD [Phycisphaeraceae bacterium]